MNTAPIAFLDSGVGGLPYYAWAKSHLPDETFVYLADRANFPYGTKSPELVLGAVVRAVEGLLQTVHPKMIVIACNTATVIAIAELRRLFPEVPFVGVVPAIKPASLRSLHRKIGVLATQRTVEDRYLKNLINEFAADCLVVKIPGGDIVEFVEYHFLHAPKEARYAIFEKALSEFMHAEVDSVVLGCTHFLFLIDEIREKLDASVEIIDSREGVGRQIIRLLHERDLEAGRKSGIDRFFVTGTQAVEERYREFSRMFGLDLGGALEPGGVLKTP